MLEGGLDIALMVILGYFFLRGLFRGVVKEVVAVLGLFVAFWVASVYWPLGDEHLRAIFDVPGQRGVTSFILIFVVVYFLISVISIFMDKIVKLTISPVISSLLGAVVGVIKGILVCSILLMGAETFLKPNEKFFTTSKIWPHMQPVTNQAKGLLPEALRLVMNAKRSLPVIGDPRGTGGGSGDGDTVAPPPSMAQVDWNTIKNIMATRPEAISQAWRDKLRNIPSGEALSPEDLKRFISEHPNLFSGAPASPTGATAPSWPQPATE